MMRKVSRSRFKRAFLDWMQEKLSDYNVGSKIQVFDLFPDYNGFILDFVVFRKRDMKIVAILSFDNGQSGGERLNNGEEFKNALKDDNYEGIKYYNIKFSFVNGKFNFLDFKTGDAVDKLLFDNIEVSLDEFKKVVKDAGKAGKKVEKEAEAEQQDNGGDSEG